jgi:hypothetical protein
LANYAEASDTIEEPVFTTSDYDAALSKWLLDQKEKTPRTYGAKVKAKIDSDKLKVTADLNSKTSPVKVNANTDKGSTYVDFYQQWQTRKQYEKNPIKLRDFDANFPDAAQGNMSQQTYVLLNQYHSLDSDAEAQKAFLEKHPELDQNPYERYLKDNPKDNAMLAIFKKETIYTQAAYDEAQRLVKELDIPQSALPRKNGMLFGLPVNDKMIPEYLAYQESVDKYGANSPEAKVILAKNDALSKVAGKTIKESVPALEIQVKNRKIQDQYDALTTGQAQDRFKADHPEYVDDLRRIDAYNSTYKYNGSEPDPAIVDKWVEYSNSTSSDERKLMRYDNPRFDQWMQDVKKENELTPFSAEALRIDVKNRDLNDQYKSKTSKESKQYFDLNHPEWKDDQYRIRAYNLQFNYDNSTASKKAVEDFVKWSHISEGDTVKRRSFRIKNPEFDLWGQMMLGFEPLKMTYAERNTKGLAAIGAAGR